MSQKFYALKRQTENGLLYLSRNGLNELTANSEEARAFFSENHVALWKKINPSFSDTIMVSMVMEDNKTIREVNDDE